MKNDTPETLAALAREWDAVYGFSDDERKEEVRKALAAWKYADGDEKRWDGKRWTR